MKHVISDQNTSSKKRSRMPTLFTNILRASVSLVLVGFIISCKAPPQAVDILVVDPSNFEEKGDGKLFRVNSIRGERTVISDFGNVAQGTPGVDPFSVVVETSRQILISDPNAGTDARGMIFRINPDNGNRAVLSDFGNAEQGVQGMDPFNLSIEASGHLLVIDPNAGTDSMGILFRIDSVNGQRNVLSDFGKSEQGPKLANPGDIEVEKSGAILVTSNNAGTDLKGALARIDPKSGIRTLLSDFGDSTQGVLGQDPFGVSVEPGGTILVMDPIAGTDSKGALFRVDPTSGARSVISDFGNPAQGPEGAQHLLPFIGLTVDPSGSILVNDGDAGTGSNGALFRVDPVSGNRTVLSDYGDAAQGPLGQDPTGVVAILISK